MFFLHFKEFTDFYLDLSLFFRSIKKKNSYFFLNSYSINKNLQFRFAIKFKYLVINRSLNSISQTAISISIHQPPSAINIPTNIIYITNNLVPITNQHFAF